MPKPSKVSPVKKEKKVVPKKEKRASKASNLEKWQKVAEWINKGEKPSTASFLVFKYAMSKKYIQEMLAKHGIEISAIHFMAGKRPHQIIQKPKMVAVKKFKRQEVHVGEKLNNYGNVLPKVEHHDIEPEPLFSTKKEPEPETELKCPLCNERPVPEGKEFCERCDKGFEHMDQD